MKQSAFVISMLLGASSAAHIKQYVAPETPTCTNANKATTVDETCSTAGNSAWNTITTARTAKPENAQADPYPGHAEHIQLEGVTGSGFKGALDFKVEPATNACTNANKATTEDETCSTAGNSAWNTITSARTAKPADAMASPYPGHAEHLQVNFDSGSSRDAYPPYVPTNGGFPKVGPDQRAVKPAVETQTPPADTDAPEAVGWHKDSWYKSGSNKSIFGNNQYPQSLQQFDSGSSRDVFPPYVPTNGGYPKVGPDQRAAKAPVAGTFTPPADTDAPESLGWAKDSWYGTGSQKSIFGNNQYPQALYQFDSGSSRDTFPPYVPTNGAYPKVGPDQRAAKAPAVETQTPPADTESPEAVGWHKDSWYSTGSQKSIFGNNGYPQSLEQFDSGSSRDVFPPYVPTNGGYPKVGPDQRAAKAPVAGTFTPPADTDAPESLGWAKDSWYGTGSQKSIFGNNGYPQVLSQFDSGSSRDVFPPYVPTNGGYPKVGPDQRAAKAPTAGTFTPPADTDAPESLGWAKDSWYTTGSQKSIFGNNQYPQSLIQLESEGVTGSGFKGALDFAVTPAANACVNTNKATAEDEDCSNAGNSAWNTITTSRTAKPADAMAAPYPAHTEH